MDFLIYLRRVFHVFFPPKWKRIYTNDGYHLGLVLQTLKINHVIDIGAASGQFARSIRDNGYKYKITSIEPLQVSWSKLNAQARRDKLWRVYPRAAMGSSAKLMLINRSENNDSSSFLLVTKKSIQAAPKSAQVQQEAVQVYSLDEVFNDIVNPADTILLKLDVQGYEDQVIKGARDSINLIKAALLEVSIVPMYENQATYQAIISMMGDLGFHPFAFFKGYCNEKTGESLQLDILFLNQRFI